MAQMVWFFSRFSHKQGSEFCTLVLRICFFGRSYFIRPPSFHLCFAFLSRSLAPALQARQDQQQKPFAHKLCLCLGYQISGQVINRVGKIADFGHKQGKGFGKRSTHSYPMFLGVSPNLPVSSKVITFFDSRTKSNSA